MENKRYFEELNDIVNNIYKNEKLMFEMEKTPNNSSKPTNYESWSRGCEKFVQDNPDFMKI